MSTRKALKIALIPTALAALLCLTGCLTAREHALRERMPQNHVFDASEVAQEMGETSLALVNRADAQSICVLRVPRESKIAQTYHTSMDLTLVVVEGSAAVQVEQARYLAEPGDAIVLPRMTAYSVLPNDAEQDFLALAVYSPEYDPTDIHKAD